MASTALRPAKEAEDLLVAILAVLASQRKHNVPINDKKFHAAFGKALAVFRRAGGDLGRLANRYYRDIVSKTYDGLDDALIVAEHYGLVRIFNPSFESVQINMTPRVASELLADWSAEDRAIINEAAVAFRRGLARV